MLTNTTEIGTATLPRRRLTIPAPTDVSPSAPRRPPRFPALAQFASAARRVPRAPIPVAFALAVLAVLATVAPEPAAAQTVTTFISNTGQTAIFASDSVQAVAFTTGTGTYTLSSVGIFINIQSVSPTPAVKIYGDSGGNPGTTLLATMTNPGTLQESAVNTYTAPANTTLSASTTYWVVTSNSAATNGQGFRVGLTNTNLDSGTAAGWSLGNARSKGDIADASWGTSNFPLRYRLEDSFGKDCRFEVIGEPTSLPDATVLAEQDPYQFQWWTLGLVKARPADEKKGADRGIDGRKYFHDEGRGGKTKQIIFSVKAGHVTVSHIRDLVGVIHREKAQIGAFLSLEPPTSPMRREAASAGFYESPWGKHPRIQLLTIEDLLGGKTVDYPQTADVTFKKAQRVRPNPSEKQKNLPMADEALDNQSGDL